MIVPALDHVDCPSRDLECWLSVVTAIRRWSAEAGLTRQQAEVGRTKTEKPNMDLASIYPSLPD